MLHATGWCWMWSGHLKDGVTAAQSGSAHWNTGVISDKDIGDRIGQEGSAELICISLRQPRADTDGPFQLSVAKREPPIIE